MLQFLNSLCHLLPCTKCQAHLKAYLTNTDIQSSSSPHLASRKALTKYLIDLHNDVNARLQKPKLTYRDVQKDYVGDYVCPAPKPVTNNQWQVASTGLALLVCGLLVIVVLQNRKARAHHMSILRQHLAGTGV
jgi:uncharacterized protein (UPF0212 family)